MRKLTLAPIALVLSASCATPPPTETPAQTAAGAETAIGEAQRRQAHGYEFVPKGSLEANDWSKNTPELRLNFSLARPDKRSFDSTSYESIEAVIGETSTTGSEGTSPAAASRWITIPLGRQDLQSATAADSSVVIVFDRSASMLPGPPRFLDKLEPAKTAFSYFVSSLRDSDRIGLVSFDRAVATTPPTSKENAASRVNEFAIEARSPAGQRTALYDGLAAGVKLARDSQIRNVLLFTDGVNDTDSYRQLSESARIAFKENALGQITSDAFSASPSIRIYTVGLGAFQADAASGDFVDQAELDRIAAATNTGRCNCLDLPALKQDATPEQFENRLTAQLKTTLSEIRSSFEYDYALTLRLNPSHIQPDDKPREVRIEFKLPGEKASETVHLPVSFPVTWRRNKTIELARAKVETAHIDFYNPTIPETANLPGIYAGFLVALGLLASLPVIGSRRQRAKEATEAERAVTIVRDESPFIGCECPNESSRLGKAFLINVGDAIVICPNAECRTPHHVSCWHMTQDRCMVRTCGRELKLPEAALRAYGLDR